MSNKSFHIYRLLRITNDRMPRAPETRDFLLCQLRNAIKAAAPVEAKLALIFYINGLQDGDIH